MEQLIIGVFEQGFIYAIMALGVYITYKILDFPDLSVDSTFPLGAAVTTVMLSSGKNPLLALIAATAAGAIAGMVTGIIHVKFKVRDLLSGIIVMTGLYTLNLRIVGGSANVPLFNYKSVFDNDFINGIFPEALAPYKTVIIIFIIMIIAKILLDLYLKTKSGYLLRAVGDNETIVTSLAKDSGFVKIVGLAISNGLVALAGSVMCQQQRFFEISMGTGTIVIGLASVIIGTNVFKGNLIKATTAVVIGSVIYKACVAIAIEVGLPATDLKLITAVLFLIILIISMDRKKKEVKGMIELKHIDKYYNIGTVNEVCLFKDFNLTVDDGDFISVIGSNGSGKTSMLNLICGSLEAEAGNIILNGEDISQQKEYIRQRKIGRVYQNPAMGTCPSMTILENMSLADNKGKKFGLGFGTNKKRVDYYRELLSQLGLGLEDMMGSKVGSLSGGQRQAMALLMTTMAPIEILILDEHTAALDPKTAELIMELTGKVVKEKKLTTIMVTHNLRYAVEYGNRILMMHQGHAVLDKAGEEKAKLVVDDLLDQFNQISIECGN